ncbi:hypothetical protein SO802_009708 [Lithocarpus litseifolius]|uniref:Suppressor of forked domain-containing protein n=1 Tax=Lithocarpus litseifolius TaxID=425828 RepID=A0AAW2DGI1_9ROSI
MRSSISSKIQKRRKLLSELRQRLYYTPLESPPWHPHQDLQIPRPDNSKLCSCGGDHKSFTGMFNGRVIHKFRGHDGEVNAVKFNEYSSVVVLAGYDQSLRAWDCKSHSTEPILVYIYFSVNTDATELSEHRLRKRKEFEDLVRRVRWNISVWIKYAQWEESQKDFNRARSVWERALEVDYRNHTLWLKYAEVEMKNKFINHARNVWDRAVTLLPRVDQLWYKYIHMEEMLGNVAGARQIFERWMRWMPDQRGWLSYVKFELRYNEIERARQIFERFVQCHPKVAAWIRYAKFEMKNGEAARSRNVYERAVEELADDEEAEQLFVAFAEFEERCKESERARSIYKFALDHIPKGRAEVLYRKFVAFEKQYGDKEGIDVLHKVYV